ncbi:GNAT family N-acetyltransferase [Cupriavidus basilensis]|uniref:GNAT family N-acetyltransferase n=1 Tax=Cupriavidus basilensis TaxID=68895 RepID=UPI00157A43A3|nr:GNAT family N-acetyltransferase [Cupriavidus basilensis]NUA28471.1 GNAT family N-acetyltransferase [Cupriavidus basilensis]
MTEEIDGFAFRPFGPADLEAAVELSRSSRWPHRMDDWKRLLLLGEGIAVEHQGKLIGTALAWRFGPSWATLGMVLVSPEFQRRGIGRHMVSLLLEDLGERSVLLHTAAGARKLYASLGFQAVGEIHQHQGIAQSAPIIGLAPGARLRPLGRADATPLQALDQLATGMPRDALLERLIERGDGVVLDRDGTALGFSFRRDFGKGQLIGPVVAPDQPGAQALIAHWVNHGVRRFVRIDVPAESGLSEWLEALGLQKVDTITAMVRGASLARAESPLLWALTAQSLG